MNLTPTEPFIAVLMALLPKCPLCWAAYASLFGVAGVDALSPGWVLPAMVTSLGANTIVLLVQLLRRRSGHGPLSVSVGGAMVVLLGRFVFESQLGTAAGVLMVLAASIWSALPASRGGPVPPDLLKASGAG